MKALVSEILVLVIAFSFCSNDVEAQKIGFSSNRTGNHEIYVMNPDGSNLINITNHPGNDYAPSYHGQWILKSFLAGI